MCGLYGFSRYGQNTIKNLSELTNSLAVQSSIRGTDATGIAFCSENDIVIKKESKAASKLNFKHSDDISVLIGHTRHVTQGAADKNYNNHPFIGDVKRLKFALTHNGVLVNDVDLRKKYSMPKSKIETDSYIAVQLLERGEELDFENIKKMAEEIKGSFSFGILDNFNNLYIVKGESPISILHFHKDKIYVYASTDEILWRSLVDSPLFSSVKMGEYEKIDMAEGEILKIHPDGMRETYKFDYNEYHGRGWWDFGFYGSSFKYLLDDYISDLKAVARYQGFTSDDIDSLLENGFSPEEIEEYIYCVGGEV